MSSIIPNVKSDRYEAAKLLDQMLDIQKITNHEILITPTHIVLRQSTDILAVNEVKSHQPYDLSKETRKINIRDRHCQNHPNQQSSSATTV